MSGACRPKDANAFAAPPHSAPCSTFVGSDSLGRSERLFVDQIWRDVHHFSRHPKSSAAVLVLPALEPRLRYLTHQVVAECFPQLKTFSVDRDEHRRTVVCLRSLSAQASRMEPTQTATAAPVPARKARPCNDRAIYRPPPARLVLKESAEHNNVDTAQNADLPVKKKSSASEVRPSAGIYVPKPRREAEEQRRLDGAPPPPPPTLPAPPKAKGQRSTRSAKTATEIKVAEEITNQVPDFASRKDTDAKLPPSISKKVSRSCSNGSSGGVGGVIQPSVVDVADLMDSFELAQLSNQLQETTLSPTSKAPSKAPSKASPKTPSTTAAEDEEDSWEKLYNESGDILRPEALEELTLAVGSVRMVEPSHDVYAQLALENHDEDLSHVIEVYDFPSSFKTEDLFNALSTPGRPLDFTLKWVDDVHALVVYSSTNDAVAALAMPHIGQAKLRPLAQASRESRTCARRISPSLQPFKPRPATSACLAKRLVTQSLGLKNTTSPEQRHLERQMLVDAKARKRLAAQQREAAWDGSIGEP